jgi:hypothetical protein
MTLAEVVTLLNHFQKIPRLHYTNKRSQLGCVYLYGGRLFLIELGYVHADILDQLIIFILGVFYLQSKNVP